MDFLPCPCCRGTDLREPPSSDDMHIWCMNSRCLLYDIEFSVKDWNDRSRRLLVRREFDLEEFILQAESLGVWGVNACNLYNWLVDRYDIFPRSE